MAPKIYIKLTLSCFPQKAGSSCVECEHYLDFNAASSFCCNGTNTRTIMHPSISLLVCFVMNWSLSQHAMDERRGTPRIDCQPGNTIIHLSKCLLGEQESSGTLPSRKFPTLVFDSLQISKQSDRDRILAGVKRLMFYFWDSLSNQLCADSSGGQKSSSPQVLWPFKV